MLRALALAMVSYLAAAPQPTLRCEATQKIDPSGPWDHDRLREGQWHVLLDASTDPVIISRCSFAPSQGRVTCDDLTVDHVEEDLSIGVKKYYVFASQYDLQVFPNMSFVENNGRESVTFGTCRRTDEGSTA